MKISEIKKHLSTAHSVNFRLADGSFVPEHFHVTEVGVITRDFIDCGGVKRSETLANFQLWNADDTEHRLKPGKLLNIISLSEKILFMQDYEIDVEYQTDTISRYALGFNGQDFLLLPKMTACLAPDKCGVTPNANLTAQIIQEKSGDTCCDQEGNCC